MDFEDFWNDGVGPAQDDWGGDISPPTARRWGLWFDLLWWAR